MAVVDKFTVYAVFACLIGVIFLIVGIYQKISGSRTEKERVRPVNVPPAQAPVEGPPGLRRRGARRQRLRVQQRDSDEEDEDDIDDMLDDHTDEKIGAKKLRKLQEKAEKKAAREAMLQEREDKKKREAEQEARRKKEEEKTKLEEAAKAEEERLKKEEQEKRDHEEYLKMKEMFSVDEEGHDEVDADLSSASLLQEFIQYIKATKVVMLEDLAAQFKLKTQDVIQRVQDLQKDGLLTGVVDDRGKFIYITMEELESVAKFIRQHGRISIAELAASSNHLIRLEPDPTFQRNIVANIDIGVGSL